MRVLVYMPLVGSSQKQWALSLTLTLLTKRRWMPGFPSGPGLLSPADEWLGYPGQELRLGVHPILP